MQLQGTKHLIIHSSLLRLALGKGSEMATQAGGDATEAEGMPKYAIGTKVRKVRYAVNAFGIRAQTQLITCLIWLDFSFSREAAGLLAMWFRMMELTIVSYTMMVIRRNTMMKNWRKSF
jgi:hypothetical protein